VKVEVGLKFEIAWFVHILPKFRLKQPNIV